MKYAVYTKIEFKDDFSTFEFISSGKKGDILKRVTFTKTEQNNIYNLALGDVDENDDFNDCIISDNGDRNKILATVASIVNVYTKRFPDRWIIFIGSTEHRTRLYRIAISLNFDELSSLYEIWAHVGDDLVPYDKNMNISAFVFKRKRI